MRAAKISRKTYETDIELELNIDGTGAYDIESGVGFLDHMLELFAKHGSFDLSLRCKGDTRVDYHHSVEDIGIVLGTAFKAALGDKVGICRYGDMLLPMDEALIMSAVDISGRAYLVYDVDIPAATVGSFDTELIEEFWLGFTRSADITANIRQLSGKNSHHIIEAVFKALAHSLKKAARIDPELSDRLLSTKGVL